MLTQSSNKTDPDIGCQVDWHLLHRVQTARVKLLRCSHDNRRVAETELMTTPTRRQDLRYEPPPTMVVEVHIMGAKSLNILRARDISLSGLGVRVPHGFSAADLNNELDLVIALPDSRSFLARGIVRHRNDDATGHFFGVELTDLEPGHRDEIRRFVERLSKLEGA